MSYTKTNWVNGVTPLSSDNLNKIEKGISDMAMDDYGLKEYTIPGETTKICKIKKLSEMYSIFEVEAPDANPEEATLSLMLPSTDNTPPYFVDFSMLNYGNYPRCSLVFQTRGGALFPVNIVFNNGIQAPCTFRFSPDGETGLFKDNPEDNRKFKLGNLGYLQDALQSADNSNVNNNATLFLYNCYCSDHATNTYTRVKEDLTCRRIMMNSEGCIISEIWAENATFLESEFVEILRVSYTNLKYRGDELAVIKRKSGAFIASEIGSKNIGIDETNNRIYVNIGGVIKYAQLI